jgi:hypothetical protein
LHVFFFSLMRTTCPAHFPWFDHPNDIFCNERRLWSSLSCNFLQPLTSSLWDLLGHLMYVLEFATASVV